MSHSATPPASRCASPGATRGTAAPERDRCRGSDGYGCPGRALWAGGSRRGRRQKGRPHPHESHHDHRTADCSTPVARIVFPASARAQVEKLFLSVMLVWLAGPSVASIVVTGLVDGKASYRELLAHLLRGRVGARWYAQALLAAPLMYVALAFALSLTSAEFLPGILITSDRSALLLMGFGYGLLIN